MQMLDGIKVRAASPCRIAEAYTPGKSVERKIMANSPAGKPPEGPPPFDPDVTSARDLRDQPISVIKTELPALAAALGVTPAELFRTLAGRTETETGVQERRLPTLWGPTHAPGDEYCCYNDSW